MFLLLLHSPYTYEYRRFGVPVPLKAHKKRPPGNGLIRSGTAWPHSRVNDSQVTYGSSLPVPFPASKHALAACDLLASVCPHHACLPRYALRCPSLHGTQVDTELLAAARVKRRFAKNSPRHVFLLASQLSEDKMPFHGTPSVVVGSLL